MDWIPAAEKPLPAAQIAAPSDREAKVRRRWGAKVVFAYLEHQATLLKLPALELMEALEALVLEKYGNG